MSWKGDFLSAYTRYFSIHKRTGVLETYVVASGKTRKEAEEYMARYGGEPQHVLFPGEIDSDSKTRKRGVWQYADNQTQLYFTCPWCGKILTTNRFLAVVRGALDSIWCSGCARHLSPIYRTEFDWKDHDGKFDF